MVVSEQTSESLAAIELADFPPNFFARLKQLVAQSLRPAGLLLPTVAVVSFLSHQFPMPTQYRVRLNDPG